MLRFDFMDLEKVIEAAKILERIIFVDDINADWISDLLENYSVIELNGLFSMPFNIIKEGYEFIFDFEYGEIITVDIRIDGSDE